jgi:hypothetical protein
VRRADQGSVLGNSGGRKRERDNGMIDPRDEVLKRHPRPIPLADRHRGQDQGSGLAPPDMPCRLRA